MSRATLISFVARSKRRREILELLNKSKELSQPEIMKISQQYKSHASRTLKELSAKKLVSCINPQDRVFRFYKITDEGRKILNEVIRLTEFRERDK